MSDSIETTIITSSPDNFGDYLKKVWKYKSLIWMFAQRDLKVKYAQTLLGLSWTVIQPLGALLIFTFFFGYILQWKVDGMPFALYVMSGLIGWNFFSFIVNSGSQSIVESAGIIKKIYVPKTILPLSKVIYGLIELNISLLLLLVLILIYGEKISINIIWIPLVLIYNLTCGLAFVFWTGFFSYKRKDIYQILPYVLYFGIWLTPVFFSEELLPESIRWAIQLNPMANVIDLWRWTIFNYGTPRIEWIINFLVVLVFTIVGLYFYVKKEDQFSDYI